MTDMKDAHGQEKKEVQDLHAVRTDLACEAGRPCTESRTRCVRLGTREADSEASATATTVEVTVTRSREKEGGRYVTLACGPMTQLAQQGDAVLHDMVRLLAEELTALATVMLGRAPGPETRVLVAGLGNLDITPDAVGPGTVRRLNVTRHLQSSHPELYQALGCCSLSALAPGVLGQTGIEAAELVRQAAATVKAQLVVAVDALAARSCERLAATIQLSDQGLSPGSGIGNHRLGVTEAVVGCPVLALGVPTVVDSSTLVLDAMEQAGLSTEQHMTESLRGVLESGRSFIVTPRDCDQVLRHICVLLSRALNAAFGMDDMGDDMAT